MNSFRDPAGHLQVVGDRVIRFLQPSADPQLDSPIVRRLMADGSVVATRQLTTSEISQLGVETSASQTILEHERIAFPSYPHEWPPEMLAAAADLTLDLSETLLADGLGLKDATPLNVLFTGPRPVFVDFLSIERRDPLDPIWTPYAQFVRTFVLPLLAAKYFGLDTRRVFETSREGIGPEEVYRMTGSVQRLLPPFLTLVTLPTWLSRRADQENGRVYRPRTSRTAEQARFVLAYLFKRLRKLIRSTAPVPDATSVWSGYAGVDGARTPEIDFKVDLVRSIVTQHRAQRVLDIGCNTGYLAAAAAATGAKVVAIDSDPVVVGAAWRRAVGAKLSILPLVVDITRPTPALGWRNRESIDFLTRARGQFDLVLMFGIIHHMLVTERVPLAEIFDLVAELTTGLALIEYVPTDDPFFQRLTRGRAALYEHLTIAEFTARVAQRFETLQTYDVPTTGRTVFLLRKR